MGPNPGKVAMLLNELGLSYKLVEVPYSELKGPEYTKINPNGRVPALENPNTGIRLWESGAIIEYLIEKYDTEHRLSFPKIPRSIFLQSNGFTSRCPGRVRTMARLGKRTNNFPTSLPQREELTS